jgi:sugar/nucleoside kinase (ribokinase family)
MLDIVVAAARPLETGTDVPGRVALVQGGSAANTARWLARLGARTVLIGAVGRDAAGRAMVDALRADGVTPRVSRVSGIRTGRVVVFLDPAGERSFVTDRGAADRLEPDDLREAWFAEADVLHLPAYSLLGEPLGAAARRAVELARAAGAAISVDLASSGPLLAVGRTAAYRMVADVAPDVLFANASEADAVLGGRDVEMLLDLATIAIVKRGSRGATVLSRAGGERSRFEVATEHRPTSDTTAAGDAVDAGFLVGWIAAQAAGRSLPASLRRAALSGHRAAARRLATPRPELPFR